MVFPIVLLRWCGISAHAFVVQSNKILTKSNPATFYTQVLENKTIRESYQTSNM